MAWMFVIVAAVFEVGWVVGLKYASSLFTWGLTGISIFISFSLLISAGKTLPVGTAYAVFVGLGTVGTVMVDHIMFAEPFSWPVLFFIILLLIGVIGLKVSTPEDEQVKGMEAS
ncbi:DMT family transporter [Halalkalibacter wakoensis]|uniref:DMT family transporter n=1 Tax=Halalkalibacter wakoensis TaxID=127891 RepID=UPI0012E138A4|nr:multidrug efflux SMR transporter [Halalkalibacter wakoensis]